MPVPPVGSRCTRATPPLAKASNSKSESTPASQSSNRPVRTGEANRTPGPAFAGPFFLPADKAEGRRPCNNGSRTSTKEAKSPQSLYGSGPRQRQVTSKVERLRERNVPIGTRQSAVSQAGKRERRIFSCSPFAAPREAVRLGSPCQFRGRLVRLAHEEMNPVTGWIEDKLSR